MALVGKAEQRSVTDTEAITECHACQSSQLVLPGEYLIITLTTCLARGKLLQILYATSEKSFVDFIFKCLFLLTIVSTV